MRVNHLALTKEKALEALVWKHWCQEALVSHLD